MAGMRLRVTFDFGEEALLEWGYLNHLRGLIYRAIALHSPRLASFLHDEGFEWNGKKYKPLTFSLLFPRRKRAGPRGLAVSGAATWFVSSPLPELVEAVAEGLLSMGVAKIGGERAAVSSVRVVEPPEFGHEALFKTLSPIVASTGEEFEGKFGKKFLSPDAPEFPEALRKNLEGKYAALHRRPPEGEVVFEPIPPFKSRLFEIEGTKVKCYELTLRARGSPELLRLAYDAGVGERNAQGFGMLGIVRGKGR